MKRIAALILTATLALSACAPVAKTEALQVTVTPGKCIAVKELGHTDIRRVCNWGKLPRTYWFPNGTIVWNV